MFCSKPSIHAFTVHNSDLSMHISYIAYKPVILELVSSAWRVCAKIGQPEKNMS